MVKKFFLSIRRLEEMVIWNNDSVIWKAIEKDVLEVHKESSRRIKTSDTGLRHSWGKEHFDILSNCRSRLEILDVKLGMEESMSAGRVGWFWPETALTVATDLPVQILQVGITFSKDSILGRGSSATTVISRPDDPSQYLPPANFESTYRIDRGNAVYMQALRKLGTQTVNEFMRRSNDHPIRRVCIIAECIDMIQISKWIKMEKTLVVGE
ncbi:hypothetical protein P152DRAFT_95348 [Eremomyces bilateralis CBS 781.70]|uniref:Uncharacterized protein n=1 Tax=Eremomyces bilateralis CBS 781.70 TaxID=1392243 RepID=A0A6G1FX66_9PEZI|nr:uncharacterized protein P152DRAFT_95348 [Eremomyces bilateralis CBS 781.70]KAF1810338.1 hypothetical protein P152DRAFT_95348 [Eremomyces bilateralis CBS 781.70]